jgi:hypothetical protein
MARNRNAGEQSGEVEAPEAEATPEAAATPAAEATEAPEAEATPEAPAAPKPTAEELTEALRVAELRSEALSLADGKLAGQIEDDAEREAFLLVVTKAVKSVSAKASKSTGTGGSRAAKKDTLSNIIERGDLAVGTVVSPGDTTATVTTDGKLDVNGTSYDNPTAAAKGAGVNGVNGWAFWQVEKDGKKVALGDLRSE